ncbi:hypothetical protein H310_12965 [Aphanomyces invadans]|uniref:Uncharacterized protein n=1 Tax=Aphanomyces invadans TaxID=157072 RepID=A0A024TFP9_9STRA|nr:hypothetical protein H310_12965 [Aphanomyces invadans]ETV92970.1 hypothetical protein H310_12965 [Aphanomyces invadans]|eukprot:XP_008878491.1 hypothetical protein H310_12965 [Aphanomyces invadans]
MHMNTAVFKNVYDGRGECRCVSCFLMRASTLLSISPRLTWSPFQTNFTKQIRRVGPISGINSSPIDMQVSSKTPFTQAAGNAPSANSDASTIPQQNEIMWGVGDRRGPYILSQNYQFYSTRSPDDSITLEKPVNLCSLHDASHPYSILPMSLKTKHNLRPPRNATRSAAANGSNSFSWHLAGQNVFDGPSLGGGRSSPVVKIGCPFSAGTVTRETPVEPFHSMSRECLWIRMRIIQTKQN